MSTNRKRVRALEKQRQDDNKKQKIPTIAPTPKRKRIESESSDSSNSDIIEEIGGSEKTGKTPDNKSKNDSHMAEKKPAVNGKSKALLDEIESIDSDISDEEGDDLEELATMDDATMEDEEDEELTDLGSFIAEDEELEDEISSVEDDSNESSIDLNIIGFKTVNENAKCLILKTENGYTIATSPFKLHKFSPDGLDEHSVQVALKALQWVLSPVDPQLFFSTIFQKSVLVVKRSAPSYYDEFFNVRAFTRMLQNNFLEYGKDLNVASYENGERETHNPKIEGLRVTSAAITAEFAKGHSIQCVHPQVFDEHIWYICELLQEIFCSFVGANNYLTPAASAGFAPHWDDIDAFMLQVEGKKYWKIYAPENSDETLPLDSSGNFTDDDFKERKPVFEGWLEQGDLLYVPRGFVHQAKTSPEIYSHHVTISVCRHHSYADFFEMASNEFITMLTDKSKRLRAALPPCLLDMDGAVKLDYTNQESMDKRLIPVAEIFARKFGSDFSAFLPSYIDLMAQDFFKTALPPLLSAEERELSCFGGSEYNLMGGPIEFGAETKVRLIRKHTQRLMLEDDERSFIVHRMANSRRYNDSGLESLVDFPINFQSAYITLADSYPKWTKVSELGLDEQKLNIESAKLLFENGLLLRKQPTEDGGKKSDAKKGQQELAKNEVQQKKDNVKEKESNNTGNKSSIVADDEKPKKKRRGRKHKKKFAGQNKE